MSATLRTLTFSVTVEDRERWPAADLAEADACPREWCTSHDDHAVHLLFEAMGEAGDRFVAGRPALFRSSNVV